MAENQNDDSIKHSITVDAPQERAFYAFAQQMTSWWPRQYTWSGERLGHIVLDPEQDARWYEVDGNGAEQPDWGRLLNWEPPHRLVLSWMTGAGREPESDPERASEVEVRFTAEGADRTRIDLEHRMFSRHSGDWTDYRKSMGRPEGWPTILAAYGQYLSQQEKRYGAVA